MQKAKPLEPYAATDNAKDFGLRLSSQTDFTTTPRWNFRTVAFFPLYASILLLC